MTSIQQSVESNRTPRPFLQSFRRVATQFVRRPLSFVGLLSFALFIFLAIFGPAIAPHEFDELIRGAQRQPPSPEYPFGTDRLGRDVYSRVLWGAREIIVIPGVATVIAVALGTAAGLTLGYYG